MKYLKKFNESKNDYHFVLTKIQEKFPKGDENDIIDMITWFETEYGDIEDEDQIIKKLQSEYK